jgi:hypothetical protein
MSTPVAIRSVDEALADALRWHLAPFFRDQPQRNSFDVRIEQTAEDRDEKPWRLTYTRGRQPLFHGSAHRVLRWALWDVHSLVHRDGRDFLFLHAGAVERSGRRIILPAGPESGKSTLVASLLQLGFCYLSDECAAIDPVTTGVYPFPKQIAVSEKALQYLVAQVPDIPDDYPGLSRELPDRFLRPHDLNSSVAGAGVVDDVVFVSAQRDGRPTMRALPPAEAIARLLDHALNAWVYGDRTLTMIARLVRSAQSYELTGGATAERAALLEAHIRRPRG